MIFNQDLPCGSGLRVLGKLTSDERGAHSHRTKGKKMKSGSWFVLSLVLFGLSFAFVPSEAAASATAMPGENLVCKTNGNERIWASVSDASPKQYTYGTVYGRLRVNGVGQSGKVMQASW